MVVLGIGFQLQNHFPVESDGIACLLTSSPLDKKPAYSHSFMEDLCLLLDAFRIVSLFLLALNFMKYLHVDFSSSCSVLSRSYTFAQSHLPSVLNFFSCKFHPTIFLCSYFPELLWCWKPRSILYDLSFFSHFLSLTTVLYFPFFLLSCSNANRAYELTVQAVRWKWVVKVGEEKSSFTLKVLLARQILKLTWDRLAGEKTMTV